MAMAFGFLLLLIGFAMLSAGIGLFIGGAITLKSGKKISKAVGRKVGMVLVSFFPLVAVIRLILSFVDPDHMVPTAALYWPLAFVCLGLSAYWLTRALSPSKPRRGATQPIDALASSDEPIVLEVTLPDGSFTPPPPTGKPPGAKPRGSSPFDFS